MLAASHLSKWGETAAAIKMARPASIFRNGSAQFSRAFRSGMKMCDFGIEPWTSSITGYYHLQTLSKAASDWPTRVADKRRTKEKV